MDIQTLTDVISTIFTFEVMLAIFLGTIGGIVIGSLPGLTATMGIALLIPVTFGMSPVAGLVMLCSIYTAGVYGGSIAAILLHTPGTPAAAATALDGYQLTLKGEGGKAIGVATISSMIGGTFSAIVLLFMAPPLSKVSLSFGPPEYFLLAVFGISIIGSLAGESIIKGLSSGVIGLFLGTVGIDLMTGQPRFTFGITSLESGISFIPAMIGLFSLSQVLILMEQNKQKENKVKAFIKGKVIPSLKQFKEISMTIIRSSFIGSFIGILPGAGGDIGAWFGYNEAKRFSKNKAAFGKGSLEGVAGPEAANNAVTGGALVPLLTLGIPGSGAAAVLLGGLLIHGLVPGRQLFTTHATTTYSIIIGFLLANVVMGIIGLLFASHLVKIANISKKVLIPVIILLCIVGSYAINNNFFDVWIMIIFGLFGYIAQKIGFHPAPLILGMILGPIGEEGFRQSLIIASSNDLTIISYLFSRGISVALMILIILSILSPLFIKLWKRRSSKGV